MKIPCFYCGKKYSIAEIQDEKITHCTCGALIAEHDDDIVVLSSRQLGWSEMKKITRTEAIEISKETLAKAEQERTDMESVKMKAVLTKRIVDMFKTYFKGITRSNFNKVFIKKCTAVMTNGKTLLYIKLPGEEAHFEHDNEQDFYDGVIRYDTLQEAKNADYVNQRMKFDIDDKHDFPIKAVEQIWSENQKYYDDATAVNFSIKDLEDTVNVFKKLKIENIRLDISQESEKPIRITGEKSDKVLVNGLIMPLRWS